ncbi:hypothetical protein HZH66_013574 [Vespula vulgaris]|uniref:Uncharacterized protein n=1 Tax=Vespula vulgaris TaxID=7454 RepID=A0A834MQZ7_VESVU|nr:hypothetical protein HZH66_013574 [Vespula vulgaris]
MPGAYTCTISATIFPLYPLPLLSLHSTHLSTPIGTIPSKPETCKKVPPVGAMYVCTLYAILFLKLWSYIQVNMWCRISRGKTSSQGRMRRQSLSYNNLQSQKKDYIFEN